MYLKLSLQVKKKSAENNQIRVLSVLEEVWEKKAV